MSDTNLSHQGNTASELAKMPNQVVTSETKAHTESNVNQTTITEATVHTDKQNLAVGLKVAIAQQPFMVGDVMGNAKKMVELAKNAHEKGANIIIFPEMALLGYHAKDLLLRPTLGQRVKAAFEILATVKNMVMLVGYPHVDQHGVFNSIAIFHNGQRKGYYHKQFLNNFADFEESRYFQKGQNQVLFDYQGLTIGLLLGEDLQQDSYLASLKAKGADILISLHRSAFVQGVQEQRKTLLQEKASKHQLPILYANAIGGQDGIVFDGGSMLVNAEGQVLHESPRFLQHTLYVSAQMTQDKQLNLSTQKKAPLNLTPIAEVYQALVVGLRDYVNHSGFQGVLLGLSGGIDSALSLCIAVDALGADKVYAVMMPYEYTSTISLQDAQAQARRLNVSYTVCPIHAAIEGMKHTLEPMFSHTKADKTEENLQARARGMILMALSNKFGHLVLTSSNKSELAVGYTTLYGDMAGGFNVLKDVYKTQVYALANYRNRLEDVPVIPERVISRPPSAELRPEQTDQDDLPAYELLDKILELYIENDFSYDAIIQAGYDENTVKKVLNLIDKSQYKRAQAVLGTKITQKPFSERHYPLINRWTLSV